MRLLTHEEIDEIIYRPFRDTYRYWRGFKANEDINALVEHIETMKELLKKVYQNHETWECNFCHQTPPDNHKDDCPMSILFSREEW